MLATDARFNCMAMREGVVPHQLGVTEGYEDKEEVNIKDGKERQSTAPKRKK